MGVDEGRKSSFIAEIGRSVFPELDKIGMDEKVILPIDEEFQDVDFRKTREIRYSGKVPKGLAVRDGIQRVRREHRPRFILHIDGSGKIQPGYLVDMIRALTETKCGACLANRTGSYGITHERMAVERFELYILEELFNCEFSDGQCGCWGFDVDKCSNMTLSAEGYELELDFLKELLDKDIDFTFIPVDITDSGTSMFCPEDHRSKLQFLVRSLKLKRWQLDALLTSFLERNGEGSLPDIYRKIVSEIEIPQVARSKPVPWRENS
jgi:hypothetical protein